MIYVLLRIGFISHEKWIAFQTVTLYHVEESINFGAMIQQQWLSIALLLLKAVYFFDRMRAMLMFTGRIRIFS